MHQTDEPYLGQYRALAVLKLQIEAMIAGLRAVCESLQDWQKTAAQISVRASGSLYPQWSEGNLAELVKLRALLVDYHTNAEQLRRLWGTLTAEQRVGLADPTTLALPPADRRP